MQHYARLRTMLTSAIRRTSTGQWKESAMRHWFRSCALVMGTALGLSLAGAPVARSAQTDNQLSVETGNQPSLESGEVISEITVGAITQRTCVGGTCACQAGEIATGGGADCAGRDTLMRSVPSGVTRWEAVCQRLTEFRRRVQVVSPGIQGNPFGTTTEDIVVDIVRQDNVAPSTTHVVCATP
jgi:hypothetical protein